MRIEFESESIDQSERFVFQNFADTARIPWGNNAGREQLDSVSLHEERC